MTRSDKIKEVYKDLNSYSEVGKVLKISRQRVHQVVNSTYISQNNSHNVIARQGEWLIYQLLSDAKWANEEYEKGENYDLTWNSIKINVKTRTKSVTSTKRAFNFSLIKKTPHVIYVLVALYMGKTYFWVESGNTEKQIFYKKIKNAITAKQLPNAIKECYEKLNKQNPN